MLDLTNLRHAGSDWCGTARLSCFGSEGKHRVHQIWAMRTIGRVWYKATTLKGARLAIAADADQRFVLRMFCEEMEDNRANNIDLKRILLGVLKPHLRRLIGYSPAAKRGRDEGMQERNPSLSV